MHFIFYLIIKYISIWIIFFYVVIHSFSQCKANKSWNQIFVQRFAGAKAHTVVAAVGGAVCGRALGIAATISLDWFVLHRVRNVVQEIGTQQTWQPANGGMQGTEGAEGRRKDAH